jgi:anionic cell wall polymer biosynthesis LytR-Cps2A-Psr (LCP) family protein
LRKYTDKEALVKRQKIDASVFLLGVIVILLVIGVFFTFQTLRSDPLEEALSGDRVINTLFVIEDNGKPLCSYVLMYYPQTRRAAIFDVPGEVGLIIPRIDRVDRIDTVYDPQKIGTFEGEIESLLGIDISYSLVFTLENLGKAVDLIEGVELFIPMPVSVYDDWEPVFLPSGVTRLDGDKSRLYLTYQLDEEENELANFRRQRFFLGLIKRLGEQNEALKNPAIAQMYQSLIKTNMNQRTRIRLFDEFTGIDTDRVTIQSVGGNTREVSGQILLFPYYEGNLIQEIVRQSLGSLTRQVEGTLTDRVFTVEVLNGTGTTGLAGRTAELLRGFGYDVISIGNADRSDYETTFVVDRSGYEDVVRTFADIIRCDDIQFETPAPDLLEQEFEINIQNLEYRSDFTLIIGRDFNGRYVTGG